MDWTTQCYRLIYNGKGGHEVWRESIRHFQLEQAKRLFKSPSFNDKAMAEALLSMVEYQDHVSGMWEARRSLPIDMQKLHSREIDHVHASCAEEIESKWDKPVMTEKEVADSFFFDAVAEQLADLDREVVIELGGGKDGSPKRI